MIRTTPPRRLGPATPKSIPVLSRWVRYALVALPLWHGLDSHAVPVTQSQAFRLNGLEASSAFTFAPFDPALGRLESVEVGYTATLRQYGALWNSTDVPAAIQYTSLLSEVKLSINGELAAFPAQVLGPDTTDVLAPISPAAFAAEVALGSTQHFAGSAPVFPSAFQWLSTASIMGVSTTPFDGTIELALQPGTWTVLAPNAFAASFLEVTGEVTATFHFSPPAVSETLPLGGVGAVLFGFFVLVASKRRRDSRL